MLSIFSKRLSTRLAISPYLPTFFSISFFFSSIILSTLVLNGASPSVNSFIPFSSAKNKSDKQFKRKRLPWISLTSLLAVANILFNNYFVSYFVKSLSSSSSSLRISKSSFKFFKLYKNVLRIYIIHYIFSAKFLIASCSGSTSEVENYSKLLTSYFFSSIASSSYWIFSFIYLSDIPCWVLKPLNSFFTHFFFL